MYGDYLYRRPKALNPLVILIPLLLILGLAGLQMLRGLPAIGSTSDYPATTVLGQQAQLPLPTAGAAILAVDGLGMLGGSAVDTRRPIASVTKVMTAYVILKNHPLNPGERGPSVTITARDATRYLQMVAEDQSTVPVTAGLVLSQYELLQGLLIPSANNLAEVLAVWDAGSVAAFVDKMNAEARALGLMSTAYADPSGFSAGSVSTARDQLILAREAMKHPVFAEIVGMQTARLPGIGLVSNVNQLLGQDGVIGIKTGFTEEAGGNLAFAARRQVAGAPVQVLGVVLGQATRPVAFEASRRLIGAAAAGLQSARIVSAGQVVGRVEAEWGGAIDVVAAEDVQMLLWPGTTLLATVEFDAMQAPLPAGAQVGWLTLQLGEQQRRVPLNLSRALPKAGLLWRLTRT